MRDEIPRKLAARRGFSVSYQGKTLLSLIDPAAHADRAADSALKADRTLYFCPSPLYGYGLPRLLGGISADSAVLCVEADEKLMALTLETLDHSFRDHPRFRLVRTRDPRALCAYARETWGSRRFRRVETLRLTGGWRLFPDLYETFAAELRRDIATDWGNAMTLVRLGRRYIRNALRNLALFPRARGIADLDFGGGPVLVLGAGPSLDMVLEGLFGGPGNPAGASPRRFRIICVDTVLPALRARNIKPDLVAALESQHWNLRDFIGLGSWELPVAMDFSALPSTAEILGDGVFLFATPWTGLRLFERLKAAGLFPEALPPLGSVGLTAVALALRLSSGPVVAGGIDFSFTPDAFHARSTPGHLERLRRQTRFVPLINAGAAFRRGTVPAVSKSGETVRSDPVMLNYRDLFEREFGREGRLWDITGPGLPLGLGKRTLSPEAAGALLRDTRGTLPPGSGKAAPGTENRASEPEREKPEETFLSRERHTHLVLSNIHTGEAPSAPEQVETLLDEADYLWAHFPECAGAGGLRPAGTDISFLKRIRTEIDPFIRLWDLALREIRRPKTLRPGEPAGAGLFPRTRP
ncbi:MAG: DUF115 domain-containing protein [Spirochaetaceae bacterium]|jgi:hypothetical protein|nr:DUF115 domain-containing protein [Spirochaetaceae bacterium]